MGLDLNNPAWAFALDFYARPGVSEACLTLQDHADADIVTLIVLLYSWSQHDRTLSLAEISALREALQDWRAATVLPLRQIHLTLKPARPGLPPETKELLRTAVKGTELLAEQIQIAMAHTFLEHLPSTPLAGDLSVMVMRLISQTSTDVLQDDCQRAVRTIVQTVEDMPCPLLDSETQDNVSAKP